MPQAGLIFRALIASPGDCIEERKIIIPEVVTTWNAVHSESTGAIVEPVKWETHSHPAMGDRPQGIINAQLLQRCDMIIGTFWTRLGTPTGKAESGTAEEIEEFRRASKPTLIYFSAAPIVASSIDHDQYKALIAYRDRLSSQGLLAEYESSTDFREQLQRHFAATMIALLKSPNSGLQTEAISDDSRLTGNAAVLQYRSEFTAFLRKLRAEWNAERDSNPHLTDDGKHIFSRARSELLNFRSMIIDDGTELSPKLDEALRRVNELQRHRLYGDGGVSFRNFWKQGDEIVALLEGVPGELNKSLEESNPQK